MSVAVYPASVAFDSPGITGSVPIRGLPGEKMYREILKNLPLPCYAVDEEGFLVFYNEEAARLWGRRPEIGKEQWSGAFRLFTSEGKELPPSLCAVACALRERRSIHGVEMIVERPDGSRRIVVDHPDPLFDADGNCLGVANVQMDVSQERETQEALRQSEALFRDIADHAPVMVWVTDADERCRFLSETWYEFTGQTEETGLGSGWLSAIHPEDREATLVPCAAAKARREGYRLEYRLLHASGEYRRVLVVANPRFGPKEEFLGYIGSVLDVTAQRKADEWAQNAAQRLRLATEARALGTWDYFPTSASLIWDNRCKQLFGLPA
jgi:PAS domain S-box-containing protein